MSSVNWPTEIADESDWEVYLELQKNEETIPPSYLTAAAATATATLVTLVGGAVSGGGPFTLTCIDDATGQWRGRIPYSATVAVDTTYKLVIEIVAASGPRRRYTVWVKIVEGDG